mgnify:CR=1 FL=1
MSGFPTRLTRAAFGPTKRNLSAGLISPEYYQGANEVELSHWQVSGMSLAIHRAWALVTWDGADGATSVSLTASGEAWDPRAQYVPTVARTSAGVYTVTYAASYPDETATEVSTALLAASATPQSSSARHATCTISSSRIVNVFVWDAAGIAADASFLVTAF